MMQMTLKPALIGAIVLMLAAPGAPAQQAPVTGPALRVEPGTALTVPNSAAGGFDTPRPKLKLDLASSDAVAGLAPGEDLVGDGRPRTPSLSAADTDSYFATKEYQDKAETLQRKGHASAGQQFAGAGKAIAGAAVIDGVRGLLEGD
jgi:hypothetical protein